MVLDLQDSVLGTFTAAGLKLKTKGSKTLTLTGAAATTLVTGHYYVLGSVDSDNAIAEASESNNIGVSTKQLLLAPTAGGSDGESLGATPKSASKAKLLTLPLTLQNIGNCYRQVVAPSWSTSSRVDRQDARQRLDIEIGTGLAAAGASRRSAGRTQNAKFKLSLAALSAGMVTTSSPGSIRRGR